MRDTEPRKGPRRDSRREAFLSCLTDGKLWSAFLLSLSERPDLSLPNLATIAKRRVELGYRSCSDLRTLPEWESVGATAPRDLPANAAIMLREGSGPGRPAADVAHYPREAMRHVPREERHAPPVSYDPTDTESFATLASALSEAGLDDLGDLPRWAVLRHYGMPGLEEPEPPELDGLSQGLESAERLLDGVRQTVEERILAVDEAISYGGEGHRRRRGSPLGYDRDYGHGYGRDYGRDPFDSPAMRSRESRERERRRNEAQAARMAATGKDSAAQPKGQAKAAMDADGEALAQLEEEHRLPDREEPPPAFPDLKRTAEEVARNPKPPGKDGKAGGAAGWTS